MVNSNTKQTKCLINDNSKGINEGSDKIFKKYENKYNTKSSFLDKLNEQDNENNNLDIKSKSSFEFVKSLGSQIRDLADQNQINRSES